MSVESSRAVFLSYASQDADAAHRICEALRGAGIEVWFDQNQLVGGDAWDQKIRRQIKDCALFVPMISASTQARTEGYFRLEWRLADQRTHLMAKGRPFLLPVAIDDTRDAEAHVPDSFTEVQWTRLRQAYGGQAPEDASVAAFCARVKVLLGDGETVGAAVRRDSAEPSRRKAAPTSKPVNRWLIPALAVVAAVVGVVFLQPWKKSSLSGPNASVPITEARQYTLKARALIDEDWMAGRESFRLAEDLCLKAVALDVSDGEAWATLARVSVEILARRYESSPQRREMARSQAERAIRLSPNSIEAGLAMASHSVETGAPADAERRFRQLLLVAPRDPRVVLGLARALARIGRFDEASEVRLNHPAFGERDPRPLVQEAIRLRARGKLAEAHALLERAQSLAPSLRGYTYLLISHVSYLADFDGARALIEVMPAQVLQEDAVAGLVAQLWLRLGDGERAQAMLGRIPRDFLQEETQDLPKGLLMGWALRISGKTAAAQAEWSQALAVVEKRLESEPNRAVLLRYRAELLALTGRVAEGEKWWKVASELPREPNATSPYHNAVFFASAGNVEESVQWLVKAQSTERQIWQQTSVRFDPVFAAVRNDPRVQRMMAVWVAELEAMRAAVKPAARTVDARSVAVLAFEDMIPNKDAEYFSDGVSEEILNALANNPALRVAARTSSFSFKGRKVAIAEIGRALNVARVIEGSVRKDGARVRITVKLINAADGFQIWSEPFVRDLTDIFALQAEIAAKVAQKLGGGPMVPSGAALPTTNLAAHDAYLRGRARQTGVLPVTDWRDSAIVHYQEAVRLDPNYALAWARIAQHSLAVFASSRDRSEGTINRAREEAANATRLDPELPEALFVNALIRLRFDRDPAAADRDLAALERRRPHDAELAAARAELEWTRGNWGARTAALVLRAADLDPRNTGIMEQNCRMLTELGSFAGAEFLLQRWSELEGSSEAMIRRRARNHLAWTGDDPGTLALLKAAAENGSVGQLILMDEAMVHLRLGDRTSALRNFQEVRNRPPQKASGPRGTVLNATIWVARLEAHAGRMAESRQVLAEALAHAREYLADFSDIPLAHSLLAIVHALRNEKVEARASADGALRQTTQLRDASQLGRIRMENADAFTLLGDHAAAIAELRALHEMGWGHGHVLRRALSWEPLRGEPHFQQLMNEAEARANAQPRPKR